MRCPNCGVENPDDYIFCEGCWTRLIDPANTAQENNTSQENSVPDSVPGGQDTYALTPGAILHNQQYRIVEMRGRGGFGITYKAFDTHLERYVAIKELCPPDALRDGLSVVAATDCSQEDWQDMIETFQHEASILAKLDHQNIVDVHFFFKENNTAYMVMEYLEGTDLNALVLDKGIENDKALRYVDRIGDALKELHKQNIVHGDVKPSNIMLVAGDRPVLIDFGTARFWADGKNLGSVTSASRNFAAPEQLDGSGNIGPHTDVYGLAATCYFLLTKNLPTPDGPDHKLENPFVEKAIKGGLRSSLEERIKDITQFLEVLWDRTSDVRLIQPSNGAINTPGKLTPPVVTIPGSGSTSALESTHAIEAEQAELDVEQAPTGAAAIAENADITPNPPDLPGEHQSQSDEVSPLKSLNMRGNLVKLSIVGGLAGVLLLGAVVATGTDLFSPQSKQASPSATPTVTVVPTLTQLPTIPPTLTFPTPTNIAAPATPIPPPKPTFIALRTEIVDYQIIYWRFVSTWSRTEKQQKEMRRPPIWGNPLPLPKYDAIQIEGEGVVTQYFEKGLMRSRLNEGDASELDMGLPVVEMLSAASGPPCIRIIGNPNNSYAPTYSTFKRYTTLHGEGGAPNKEGQVITQTLDTNGTLGSLTRSQEDSYREAATVALYREEVVGIEHNIPRVFWDYLNKIGPVYVDSTRPSEVQLIQGKTPFEITGEPISEAYWVPFGRGNKKEYALIQAFQRRILSYVPSDKDTDFQVEMVNTGRHYYEWTYLGQGVCPATPTPTSLPTSIPTSTPRPTPIGSDEAR